LLTIADRICWQFLGGVDFRKPIDKYNVSKKILPLSLSIWAYRFGQPGFFSAPNMKALYRAPSVLLSCQPVKPPSSRSVDAGIESSFRALILASFWHGYQGYCGGPVTENRLRWPSEQSYVPTCCLPLSPMD